MLIDRQLTNLRLMADPCTYTDRLTRSEKDHVRAALDEIERLQTLADQFVTERSSEQRRADRAEVENAELRAENERLGSEISRLREAEDARDWAGEHDYD